VTNPGRTKVKHKKENVTGLNWGEDVLRRVSGLGAVLYFSAELGVRGWFGGEGTGWEGRNF